MRNHPSLSHHRSQGQATGVTLGRRRSGPSQDRERAWAGDSGGTIRTLQFVRATCRRECVAASGILLRSLLLSLTIALAGTAIAQAQGPSNPYPSPPTKGALYRDGQYGRYLLGGTWLYRPDTSRCRDRAGVVARRRVRPTGGRRSPCPERLQRRRLLEREHERLRRLVPQGLHASRGRVRQLRARDRRVTGSSASSRSTTARPCG